MLTCGLQRLRVEGCVGYLDGVRHRIAFGWAFHRAHPQIRLSVLIKLNGRLLGSAKANRFRSDLHNAGIGDGHCGFEFAHYRQNGRLKITSANRRCFS